MGSRASSTPDQPIVVLALGRRGGVGRRRWRWHCGRAYVICAVSSLPPSPSSLPFWLWLAVPPSLPSFLSLLSLLGRHRHRQLVAAANSRADGLFDFPGCCRTVTLQQRWDIMVVVVRRGGGGGQGRKERRGGRARPTGAARVGHASTHDIPLLPHS